MPEALWVIGMLLLTGAFAAIKLVAWIDLLWVGKTLMLDSAALGIPLEAAYFAVLGASLSWSGAKPRGWFWRPFQHHHLLSRGQRLLVLPLFGAGSLAFLGIVLGI